MTQWEYSQHDAYSEHLLSLDDLNAKGAEGWELCDCREMVELPKGRTIETVTASELRGLLRYTFKRPRQVVSP